MMETAPPPSEGTPLDRGLARSVRDRGLLPHRRRPGAARARAGARRPRGQRSRSHSRRPARRTESAAGRARSTAERLATLPTPAIVRVTAARSWCSAAAIRRGSAGSSIRSATPSRKLPLEDLAREIGGQALLIARRIGGAGVDPRQFGFRWFLPSIWRYRRPLGHVLVGVAVRADFRPRDAAVLPGRRRQGAGPSRL